MSEQFMPGPQPQPPSMSDRMVRFLGAEIANLQIAGAAVSARMEILQEIASDINVDRWERIPGEAPEVDNAHEGVARTPVPMDHYLVPAYEADIVMRLLALLGR